MGGLSLGLAGLAAIGQARADGMKSIPVSVFAAQVAGARQLIAACARDGSACGAGSLPGREQVQGGPGGAFFADWDWLRQELNGARAASPASRAERMRASETHLDEVTAEAGAAALPRVAAEFARARTAANAALARDEFRADAGPTWFQRQIAKIQDWILRLFTGMDRLGRRAPWLAPLVEWGCFALAAAGLLWFVRRSLARQVLRISLTEGAALVARGDRNSADWAHLAQERAAAQDWREAIHCLYWAAIALMEGRRAWKPNATRTPREYLRLLRPGSEAHAALRELTRTFERVWYGSGSAEAAAYQAALRSLGVLETARMERSSPESVTPDAGASGPFAVAGGA